MLVPMGSSDDFLEGPTGGYFVRSRVRKQSVRIAELVPRMLRNAPLLRRGALLIRGLWDVHRWVPALRSSAKALHRVRDTYLDVLQPNKKAPAVDSSNLRHRSHAQCASAQTFFLVKYISPANMIRNTNTCSPIRLRASMCGSAVHIRKVVTSPAYCATVAGEPSSNVSWPGKYLME